MRPLRGRGMVGCVVARVRRGGRVWCRGDVWVQCMADARTVLCNLAGRAPGDGRVPRTSPARAAQLATVRMAQRRRLRRPLVSDPVHCPPALCAVLPPAGRDQPPPRLPQSPRHPLHRDPAYQHLWLDVTAERRRVVVVADRPGVQGRCRLLSRAACERGRDQPDSGCDARGGEGQGGHDAGEFKVWGGGEMR